MTRKTSVLGRFRLAGAAVLFGVGLVAVAFYANLHDHFLGIVVNRTLGPFTDALADVGFTRDEPDIWQRIAERHEVAIRVDFPDGRVVAYDERGQATGPEHFGGARIRSERVAEDGTRVTFHWTLSAFRYARLPIVAALLLTVAAVVGTAFWFLHRQLKPLAALRGGVDAVSRGEFSVRVPVVRNDEIGDVAEAFNLMTRRVGEMIDDRERLLADVSHELRSPIARMKVAVELLPEGDKRSSLAGDLKEMESLIAALLDREALRSRGEKVELAPVDLASIVRDVAADFEGRPPGVEPQGEPTLSMRGDAVLLKLLIKNLIDNAVKFSRPDSAAVTVEAAREDERIVVRVADDGVGFDAKQEERLFEPFVKLDRARGHHVGYGLGLDLCKRIVLLHGGTIRLKPRRPRGAEAVVTFESG